MCLYGELREPYMVLFRRPITDDNTILNSEKSFSSKNVYVFNSELTVRQTFPRDTGQPFYISIQRMLYSTL